MSPTTRAFVRRPSPHLAHGQLTHLTRQPVDLALALQQYEGYLALLRTQGHTLFELPELPDHPDGVFVEDVLLMVDGRAVLTRPGALSRRDEVASVEPVLQGLGVACARIEAPGTLDGGDVLVLERHVLVGRSTRTNDAGFAQLAALLVGSGRTVLRVEVGGALHLKTALTSLPDGQLIAAAEWVDTCAVSALGYAVLDALESSAANVLCLGDTVVLPADAPRTVEVLLEQGYNVILLDVGELQKLEAGLTCMSVLF